MICPSFTASDRAALEAERYLHPHPKVQRKMEAVYLKSLALPHHLICRKSARKNHSPICPVNCALSQSAIP